VFVNIKIFATNLVLDRFSFQFLDFPLSVSFTVAPYSSSFTYCCYQKNKPSKTLP